MKQKKIRLLSRFEPGVLGNTAGAKDFGTSLALDTLAIIPND